VIAYELLKESVFQLKISFWYVEAYELLRGSGFQLFWYAKFNYQIIFAFGWVEDAQIQNYMCFSYLNHIFVTAVMLLGK